MSIKLKDTIYDLVNNADKIDGIDSTSLFRKLGTNVDINTFADNSNKNGIIYINTTTPANINAPFSYGTILSFNSDAGSWMLGNSSSGVLKFRSRWWSGNGGTWGDWKDIAFKTDIPTIPTALKNPNSLTIQANGTSLGSYDGSAAKTFNITYSNVGAAASSHTHNYAGSSSAGGVATSAAKLSTARTISLTGSVTGSGSFDGSGNLSIATTTNHNHNSSYITALGTSGNYLTWTKNGTTNNITIPYATNADTVDACHIDEGIPYAYSYTSSGSGTWYLKISASMWGNFHGIVFVNTSGDNCSGRLIVHTGSRTNNYWGWCLGYNGIGITGIHKDISGDTANIYLRMTFPNATIKTTFPATITKTQSGSYDGVPSDGGLFGDVFTGYATSAGSVAWGNVTGKPSSFNPSSHTHNSVTDYSNGTAITFQYSTGGFTSNPSWLGAWNGYQLTYVSPSVLSVNYANSAGSAGSSSNAGYCYVFHNINNKTAYPTVGSAKNKLAELWGTDGDTGIGRNIIVSESVISQWGNDSASTYDSSVYSMIKIGGGYNRNTYGQYLLSTYASNRIGYIGRNGGNWTTMYWLATTSDLTWNSISGKPSSFTPASHNHSAVLDIGNSTSTTFAYSKAGLNYSDYTWLAGWNGYELRVINKSQFAQASHTHDYAASNHSHSGYMTTSSPTGSGTLMMNGSNSRGSYPAVKWHIGNVNWAQIIMNGSGELEFRGGASQDTSYITARMGACVCTSLYVGGEQITFTT